MMKPEEMTRVQPLSARDCMAGRDSCTDAYSFVALADKS
jgi:hypothetical protein